MDWLLAAIDDMGYVSKLDICLQYSLEMVKDSRKLLMRFMIFMRHIHDNNIICIYLYTDIYNCILTMKGFRPFSVFLLSVNIVTSPEFDQLDWDFADIAF